MDNTPKHGTKKFYGWRLLGVIMIVMISFAIISALVDWIVLG